MEKIYLDEYYIGSNWAYFVNENDDIILLDLSSEDYDGPNNETQFFQCNIYYPKLNSIISDNFRCTYSDYTNLPRLKEDNFSSSFWYRLDLPQALIIFTILFLFGIYMPYKILSRLFGRWLKV